VAGDACPVCGGTYAGRGRPAELGAAESALEDAGDRERDRRGGAAEIVRAAHEGRIGRVERDSGRSAGGGRIPETGRGRPAGGPRRGAPPGDRGRADRGGGSPRGPDERARIAAEREAITDRAELEDPREPGAWGNARSVAALGAAIERPARPSERRRDAAAAATAADAAARTDRSWPTWAQSPPCAPPPRGGLAGDSRRPTAARRPDLIAAAVRLKAAALGRPGARRQRRPPGPTPRGHLER
jgi:hypothetical protein